MLSSGSRNTVNARKRRTHTVLVMANASNAPPWLTSLAPSVSLVSPLSPPTSVVNHVPSPSMLARLTGNRTLVAFTMADVARA